MQRLGAVFIAICMVAISLSVGAMLHLKFGLSITEASPFSFGILLTLLLVHYQISRVRDRLMLDEQMDDLTRLKLALTKEVQDVRDMARELDSTVTNRLEKEMEPILAELDVIGTLVKQLAESCADLDDRVQKGDRQVAEVHAKLVAATGSVKELEEHLRANARSLAAKSERAASERLASERLASTPAPTSAAERNMLHPEPMTPEPMKDEGRGYATERQNSYSDEPQAARQSLESQSPERQSPERQSLERLQGGLTGRHEKQVSPEDEIAVRRALALGHIELFMQPIVSLPMRKPQFYEALTRLKKDDGDVITPDIFLPVCRKNAFLPMLDRLAINEAFRLLRRLADRGHPVDLFCNLSLESLADSDFFALMRDLFDQNRDLAPHVILEFAQADMRSFGLMEEETIKLLSSMGFRFSVDRVTNLAAGFDDFARQGVKFAKIAAPILTHREAGRGLDIHPADFSRLLSRKGMDLIVTHVESETDLVNLIDYNIHLAQGNHFAPAKALKGTAPAVRAIEKSGTIAQQQQAAATQRDPRLDNRGMDNRVQPKPRISAGAVQSIANRVPPAPAPQSAQVANRPAAMAPSAHPAAARADTRAPSNTGGDRVLGENPRIAQALRAMAAEDGNKSEGRDHFRAVLAEAAGLLEPGTVSAGGLNGGVAPSVRATAQDRPQQQRIAGARSDRLPAADDFGLQTGTDRGQYIEVS
nr:EAL domain-containing protein [uncultured Cohaesibacter sp.]